MIETALILSGLLQLADAWSTLRILQLGGVERNPVLRWLMKMIGQRIAVTLKTILIFGVLIWCWATDFFSPAPWAIYIILALSIGVVGYNFAVIHTLQER